MCLDFGSWELRLHIRHRPTDRQMQIPEVISHIWNFWCQRPGSNQGPSAVEPNCNTTRADPEDRKLNHRTGVPTVQPEPPNRGPNRRGTNRRYAKDGTNFKISIRAGRAKESLRYQKHTMVKIRDFKMLECADTKVGSLQFLFILEIFVNCNSSLFGSKFSRKDYELFGIVFLFGWI